MNKMPERIFIRDPFDGKSKEDEDFMIEYVNRTFTKIKAIKNPVKYDIDVIIYNNQEKKIAYLEVEGNHEDSWSDTERSTWPSNLMTMPIRKMKYFIQEYPPLHDYLLENSTIEKDQFIQLYCLNDEEVTLNVIEGLPRFWIKISNCGRYFCICSKEEIVEKINQSKYYPDKRIMNHEGYFRNIWYNKHISRDDKTFLVLGEIDGNELFFGKFEDNDLYRYLKKYISDIDE